MGGTTAAGLTHRLRSYSDPPQPLGGFATALVALLIVIAVLYAISFLVELAYIQILQDYLGGDATLSEVEDLQAASGGVQFLAGILSLVVAGLFIAWLYRAYKNLLRTSVARLRYDPAWTIGAWFIPIFCWIRPKQIVNDVWRAGEAGAEVRDGSWRDRPVSQLLHWWWGVWVAAAIVGIAAVIAGADSDLQLSGRADFEREQEAATIAAPGILCTIAAAILACIVIRRITERGDQLRKAVLAATPIPPTPPLPPPQAPLGGPPPQPAPAPLPQPAPAPPGDLDAAPGPALVATGSKIRCTICGWVFTDPESAREHVATHHPGDPEAGPP